ncbi:hypothetical protein [Permianibacter aggregans]|uniref:homoserine dehydrogenase n=1 Tax=Permianibacter aggregans TaxID=1510150 RepID=A0A4V3D8D7_9GAMM|nr:hypothetical protein [Permianibacter aggregans]QGX41564.1 hypothetical protein E2H98_18580 [Permianibacter aggregans]TDQ51367.1 homoserine dehydrogenase [Permianibacter aggregans]
MSTSLKKKTITLKFGGSTLASATHFLQVAEYLKTRCQSATVIAVVSATKGTTDALYACTQLAKHNREQASQALSDILAAHNKLVTELLPASFASNYRQEIAHYLEQTKTRLQNIHQGENIDWHIAFVLSLGEKLSASLLSALLQSQQRTASWVPSELLIRTDSEPFNTNLDQSATEKAFAALNEDYFQSAIRIITGFCGADKDGRTTLLGRNASDYSAAIVTAFAADELELLGDTAGILSADPDYVPGAETVAELSVEDACLLSQCGAGVLHPRTLEPLLKTGKSLRLGTLQHEQGTSIRAQLAHRQASLLAAWSPPQHAELSKKPPLPLNLKKWQARFPESSLVSVFLADHHALRYWQNLLTDIAAQAGVSVLQRKLLSKQRVIVFAIPSIELQRFTRLLHSRLYPLQQETAVAIIGASGRIGRQTLQLLLTEGQRLFAESGTQLRVIALCNSKQTLWCKRHENDCQGLLNRLAEQPLQQRPASLLAQELLSQGYDKLVVVDASASSEIAGLYEQFLAAGVAVVTPNKLANSDALQRFTELQSLARKHRVPYCYETTVAAALPVLKPLLDLRRAGDTPHHVEAVLSGTIGFVLDSVQQGTPFSAAVQQAVEKGYAEPDPLQDLSGEDVARKMLILLRTCGIRIERSEIELTPLHDTNLHGPINQQVDERWRQLVLEVQAANQRLCYAAQYRDGNVSVGLKRIDAQSPFYRLRGTENAVIYQSTFYQDIPLTVTGPGAGINVTSAGLFADIVVAAEALSRRAPLSAIAA